MNLIGMNELMLHFNNFEIMLMFNVSKCIQYNDDDVIYIHIMYMKCIKMHYILMH